MFIGDKNKSVFTNACQRFTKRDITSEFFEIPTIVNTSVIKESIQTLAEDLKARGQEVKAQRTVGFTSRHYYLCNEVFRTYH
ncbi:DUF1887 family CARF protein [Vibrio lentus]|nr:DUF1887 family CARF protein [Vibrio lentus]